MSATPTPTATPAVRPPTQGPTPPEVATAGPAPGVRSSAETTTTPRAPASAPGPSRGSGPVVVTRTGGKSGASPDKPSAIDVSQFPPTEIAAEPPFHWPSPRAPLAMFLIMVLISGVLYPGAMTLVADEIAPVNTHELFLLIGENISNPALFWERPSQIDWTPIENASAYNGSGTAAGDQSPWGPVSPALINETMHYVIEYGLQNSTVPLDLVSDSASGLDPDVYPDAALIQIPRVVHYSGLPLSQVWGMVNDSITAPQAGIVGPYYVDVIALDQTLLNALPPGTPVAVGGS